MIDDLFQGVLSEIERSFELSYAQNGFVGGMHRASKVICP
jgi:hypothetical protein